MWARTAQLTMSSCSPTTSSTPSQMPTPTTPSDTGTVRTRVTSTRLIGRAPELAELEAALADAARGRPSVAFVAGESGVGKTRLVTELADRAHSSGARVLIGECVELGEGELPYAPLVAALRSLARDGDPVLGELDATTRAGLAAVAPRRRQPGRQRPGPVARLRGAADAARGARPRRPAAADRRGPPLGRRLDARVHDVRRPLAALRAGARRRHLPLRRAAPPPPAAPAAGRARARRPRPAHRPRPPVARRARRAAGRHPRRGARRRPRRPPARPQRGQPAVHRGAAGRGARRPRRAAPDAARRAHGPRRGAERRRAGAAARARGRRPARPRAARRPPPAWTPPRCATPCATRSRGTSSSPTGTGATASATPCCARSSPTTCCPARTPS